jgi:hypothetical protein
MMAADAAVIGDGHWLLVLREADEAASIAKLAKALDLAPPEAELLFGLLGDPIAADQARALGLDDTAFRTRLAAVCARLSVPDAAAALVLVRRALAP